MNPWRREKAAACWSMASTTTSLAAAASPAARALRRASVRSRAPNPRPWWRRSIASRASSTSIEDCEEFRVSRGWSGLKNKMAESSFRNCLAGKKGELASRPKPYSRPRVRFGEQRRLA